MVKTTPMFGLIFTTLFRVSQCMNIDNSTINDKGLVINDSCRLELLDVHGGLRVTCDTPDVIHTLPKYPNTFSHKIFSIVIRNQPRLTQLTVTDLAQYPSLTELVITNSGLATLEIKAFTKIKHLRKLNLRSNALENLDWRSMVNLRDALVDTGDNPFICNCSLFWLASWNDLVNKRAFLSPDGTEFTVSTADAMTLPKEILHLDAIRCVQEANGIRIPLSAWKFMSANQQEIHTCSIPQVDMTPIITPQSTSYLLESGKAQFECLIKSSQPLDLDFRQTFQLKIPDPVGTRNRMSVSRQVVNGQSRFILTLSNVSRGQMGWYVCVGLSVSGPNFDMAALVVHSKPSIRVQPQNRSWSVDHYVDTFEFTIYAFPAPISYNWLKNNVSIELSKEAHKHVFQVLNEESQLLRNRGFFYAFRPKFVIKLRYLYSFFEGDYALETCNIHGCDRLDFLTYDKISLPKTGPDRPLNDSLNARIGSPPIYVPDSRTGLEMGWMVAVVFMGVGFSMFLSGLIFFYLRFRRGRPTTGTHRRWMASDAVVRGPTGPSLIRNGLLEPTSVQLSSYTSNVAYEPLLSTSVPVISKNSLEIVRVLGEGAFGRVNLAYCKFDLPTRQHENEDGSGQNTNGGSLVAAKTLKRFTPDRSQEVAKEAELMAKLNHPNIVTFYGVCFQGDDDLLLIYEYMELGDLKKFLALHGPHPELASDEYTPMASTSTWPLSDRQLIDIACQVAQGLTYLHENHFVHRDLACRNCLVKGPLLVKLSDFGMTRDVYSNDYYRLSHKAPLPVRWLPPESLLYGRFSEQSDIWSFGVVVWEISTYGRLPWYEYSNVEVMQRVNGGETLAAPLECHQALRDVMMGCWKRTPSQRSKLTDIVRKLSTGSVLNEGM